MKKILKLCFNTSEWSPNRSEWLRLLSSLPKNERDRIGTFAYKRDSKNSLAGQILLRMCIKRLVPRLDWPNIVIERNQKGRPCLKLKESLHLCNITDFGPRVIDLNVTHAGDLCAVVAAIRPSACGGGACSKSNGESCWLGVDCMKIEVDEKAKETTGATSAECDLFDRQISKYEKVIRSRFSQTEKDYVYNRVNSAEKLAAFYRLWCLKESYAKATGLGISGGGIDPSKLEFQIAAELMIDPAKKTRFLVDNSKLVVNGKPKKECKFYEQYWVPNANRFDLHIIAVCLIDADDSDKLGKWEALGDEFVEISAKDMFDEFSKSNPPCTFDEAKSKEFDEQWTNFNKKL